MKDRDRTLDLLWQLPLICFIIAGITGFLYRLGLVGITIWDLHLENIRHAHSHLMFFCWAVPLPMYFIIRGMEQYTGRIGSRILMRSMALSTLLLGLVSYPFFLFYGYRPVSVAGMDLPFSVIFSGLVMVSWYGFIAGYLKERKHIADHLSTVLYDGALIMLFICSLGAWGVAVVQFLGLSNPLYGKALTHFFLATFTEGWIVLVLLGLIYEKLGVKVENISISPALLVGFILFGAPLTFPYGISEGLLTSELLIAARVGGLLATVGLGLNLYVLYRHANIHKDWYWFLILLLLVGKALAQLVASVLPSTFWLSEHGLRIFYLHLLLLGAFTLGMFKMLHVELKAETGLAAIATSILLVLGSLLLFTPMWPSTWFVSWYVYVVAGIALLPALAALYSGYWLGKNRKLEREA